MRLAGLSTGRLQLVLVAAVVTGAAAVASVLFWQALWNDHRASLTRLSLAGLSSGPCPAVSASAATGPAIRVVTEQVIQADLVAVLRTLTRQGWTPSTYMTTNIKLIPTHATAVHLGVGQVRVFRGLSLAYTHEGATRLVSFTSVVLCPP